MASVNNEQHIEQDKFGSDGCSSRSVSASGYRLHLIGREDFQGSESVPSTGVGRPDSGDGSARPKGQLGESTGLEAASG